MNGSSVRYPVKRTRTMVTPECGWSRPVASRPWALGNPAGSRYRRTSQEDSMKQVTRRFGAD
jgi:hypothetical protein